MALGGCVLMEDLAHLLGAAVGDFDTDMRLICHEGLTEAFLLARGEPVARGAQKIADLIEGIALASAVTGRVLLDAATHLIERLPACPIPEIARLGRTLRKWKDAFLAYFDTDGASNGPTEAINGIIELGRRTARGYRNPTNYRLRMLLIAGGLDASTHTQL